MPFPVLVSVALPVPLPRHFDYLPPTDGTLPAIGSRVRVPFGQRELTGVVIGHTTADPTLQADWRPLSAVLDEHPLLPGELLASLRWLARYLHAPLGEVLATALPTALRRGDALPDTARHGWALTEAGRTALPALRTGQPRTLAERLQAGPLSERQLDAAHPGWRGPARRLHTREWIERIPLPAETPTPQSGPALNDDQQTAADAIRAAHGFTPFLLDGVTGSGKTEVYLDAIAHCLQRGRQALVLVPEIGLTPQLLQRFRQRLGITVHALHSALGDGERAAVWTAALRGDARVIVGTRSAVFVPLPDAGVIIVDEEHDGSYKQFDGIRYHARDVALVRARALDVPIVLGSATPALESLHNARTGRYRLLRLPQRAGSARPPEVRILDVRKRPLQAGLSPELLQAIDRTLTAGGQVLVFRNRRGYAPVLQCHDCGYSAHCPRCSTPLHATPMTVHAGGRRLQCHHCGRRQPAPLACPDCGGLALQPQGNGTERIEALLAERYSDHPVVRIDRGNTRQRDALQRHFEALGHRPGILVGTQMLAKGHDLPNLLLVAVVGVDEGLFSADFRGSEKLAQLLIQVAGRAGRADRPGQVILQTHHPDHPLLNLLIHGGYHAFADSELPQREAAEFPPYSHLALLRAEARHADPPQQFLQAAVQACRHAIAENGLSDIHLHGPLPAPMPRRAGYQRLQLLVRARHRKQLQRLLDAVVPQLHDLPAARKLRWSLDVDPVDLG